MSPGKSPSATARGPGRTTAIDGVKDSAGRTGVGIADLANPHANGSYLTLDPKTYAFLGFRVERTSR